MKTNSKANLITKKQIKEILYVYNIGKRPLSLLLDFGEVTITRYLDGQTPNKKYSDKLLALIDSPEEMKRVLEAGKNKISSVAYEKCLTAVENLLSSKKMSISMSKIDNVASYLINKLSEVTPFALQKLLYYSQGFYSAFFNEFLFDDECEAWIYGPVYTEVYHRYKNDCHDPLGRDNFESVQLQENFTAEEYALLDSIIKNFGCYSGKILEEMTKAEEPWRTCIRGKSGDKTSNGIISNESIQKFFIQIKQKYGMLNLADIKDYSENLIEKIV